MKITNQAEGKGWIFYHADAVDVLRFLPEHSIGFSIFSPPYGSLFVYSNSERDLGNCPDDATFLDHFDFIVRGLLRCMQPGRIVAVDCMNILAMKERDGYIGLKDFRGELIRAFQKHGFIFHSEHCIWKDPLIEATRTKALGLMHKQLCKDSAMCRAGIPQYLLAFRTPGVNPVPVNHPHGLETFIGEDEPTKGTLSHERWRRYASPVWMDIDSQRTLNVKAARDGKDERHICPMSLDIIERAVHLWTKEGDSVLSPFGGIGSEGYGALRLGRRFVGIELKESYWKEGCRNLTAAAGLKDGELSL